jgi:hypothetical protein
MNATADGDLKWKPTEWGSAWSENCHRQTIISISIVNRLQLFMKLVLKNNDVNVRGQQQSSSCVHIE